MFFFFTQKTAYELRMSDWSSAVCSSDLGGIGGGGRIAPPCIDHPPLGDADLLRKRAIFLGLSRLPPQRVRPRFLIGDHLVEPREIGLGRAQFLLGILATDVQPRNPRPIGRASCRERGCQYV